MVLTTEAKSPESAFYDFLLPLIGEDPGRTLIQAGHFMLSCSCNEKTVWPCVAEDMIDASTGLAHREAVLRAIGTFPYSSWNIGLHMASVLKAKHIDCALVTVVNDWQQIPKEWPGGAEAARRLFYSRFPAPLPSYRVAMAADNLSDSLLLKTVGNHGSFISENWLRRRLERTLKNMRKRNLPGSEKLREDLRGEHACIRFSGDQEETGLVLYQGSANCAGEIVELVKLAHDEGFSTFVNLYPMPCRTPVNEGTKVAIHLFGLTGIRVVNVGFACSGEGTMYQLLNQQIHANMFTQSEDRHITWTWGSRNSSRP